MLMKKPRNRVFDYTPRFYNPQTDKDEKIKRRLGFTRKTKALRKNRSPFFWLIILAFVIYLYLKFSGLA
jgi:hypothetical protein